MLENRRKARLVISNKPFRFHENFLHPLLVLVCLPGRLQYAYALSTANSEAFVRGRGRYLKTPAK